jgi:hypothetical protein
MLIQVLVKEQIDAGSAILEALRNRDIQIDGAFWLRMPESGHWRLIVSSRLVAEKGPLYGYQRLRQVQAEQAIQAVPFDDISFLSPTDPEYLRLREYAVGPNRFGVGPASGHMLHNLAFEDAYVYFL